MRIAATADRAHDERGFTLVELLVSMSTMAIVVAAVMAVLFRAYGDTGIVSVRSDALNNGRIGLERMSKQVRQTSGLVTAGSSQLVFDTYIDGAARRVEWRASGGALQTRMGSAGVAIPVGTPYVDMATGLTSPSIFTYNSGCTAVSDITTITQVCINLDLSTKTDPIPLTTTVDLRNL
jgi:type II secretory pathway pseudopilin PulG